MKNEIKKLVDEVLLYKNNKNCIVVIGKVTSIQANKIKKKTGLVVRGYQHVIDSSGVRHVLNNHAKQKEEIEKGQIPVELKDFQLIPQIIKSDNIIYAGKSKLGLDTILYEELIGNNFFYVEELRKGKKQLVIKSMWKKKIKK